MTILITICICGIGLKYRDFHSGGWDMKKIKYIALLFFLIFFGACIKEKNMKNNIAQKHEAEYIDVHLVKYTHQYVSEFAKSSLPLQADFSIYPSVRYVGKISIDRDFNVKFERSYALSKEAATETRRFIIENGCDNKIYCLSENYEGVFLTASFDNYAQEFKKMKKNSEILIEKGILKNGQIYLKAKATGVQSSKDYAMKYLTQGIEDAWEELIQKALKFTAYYQIETSIGEAYFDKKWRDEQTPGELLNATIMKTAPEPIYYPFQNPPCKIVLREAANKAH